MKKELYKNSIILDSTEALLKRDGVLYHNIVNRASFTSNFESRTILNKELLFANEEHMAKSYGYLQTNYPNNYRLLVADIDYSMFKALDIAIKHNVVPNFIIKNKDNDRAHFVYIIKGGVSIPKGNKDSRAYRLFDLVKNKLYHLLNADKQYQHVYFKNPWNPKYEFYATATEVYVLNELNTLLPEFNYTQKKELRIQKSLNYVKVGERNLALFDATRRASYGLKKCYPTYAELYPEVLKIAEAGNKCFEKPLDIKEVQDLARSIAMYTESNDVHKHKKRGSANIDPSYDLATKQSLGAYYSHEERKKNTIKRLRKEYADIKRELHREPTVKELCAFSSSAPKTIKQYWQFIIKEQTLRDLQKKGIITTKVFSTEAPAKPKLIDTKLNLLSTEFRKYYLQNNGEEPTIKYLADITKVDPKTIRKYKAKIWSTNNSLFN